MTSSVDGPCPSSRSSCQWPRAREHSQAIDLGHRFRPQRAPPDGRRTGNMPDSDFDGVMDNVDKDAVEDWDSCPEFEINGEGCNEADEDWNSTPDVRGL